MIALPIFIGMVALFLIIGLVIHNRINNLANAVERSWADVITQQQQKSKVIPYLEKMLEEYKQDQGILTEAVISLRRTLQDLYVDKVDPNILVEIEKITKNILQEMQILAANNPQSQASLTHNNLILEITEQQENVDAAIRIFNQNADDLNRSLEVFPHSLINDWFNRKQKVPIFSASEVTIEFECSPDVT